MRRFQFMAVAVALFLMMAASACSSAPSAGVSTATAPASSVTSAAVTLVSSPTTQAPASSVPTVAATLAGAPATAALTARAPTAVATAVVATTAAATPGDIVVYASDLQQSDLTDEFMIASDPASPGGKMVVLPNAGDKLSLPPEDDPHVTFKVNVQAGVPYRCWIHMKVGAPKGVARANLFYEQFSEAVDKSKQPIFIQGTASYLTAQGSERQGWSWVGCDSTDPQAPDSLIYFPNSDMVTARLQAGMEGVGFDQFLLSPARFLTQPPTDPVVQR